MTAMNQFAERIHVCVIDDTIIIATKNESEYSEYLEKTRHSFHDKYMLHIVVDICHNQVAAIFLQGSVSNCSLYDRVDQIKQILIDEFICKQYPHVVLSGWTTDPEIRDAIHKAAQDFYHQCL